MKEITEKAENVDFITALKELTDKIKNALQDQTQATELNVGMDIKHELVFSSGKEPIHRLSWITEKN